MNKSDILQNYQQRQTKYEADAQALQTRINQISLLRLMEFLLGALLVYWVAQQGLYLIANICALVAIVLFFYLVRIHAHLKTKKQHAAQLAMINHNESEALQGRGEMFGEGEEYKIPSHPYANDLDIFGKKSIFQFLNRTASRLGKNQLAAWLSQSSLDSATIRIHQDAIKNLKDRLDYRQNFQAYSALHQEKPEELKALLDWLQSPVTMPNQKIYRVILILFPLITLGIVITALLGIIQARFIFIPVLINLSIVSLHLQKLLQHSKQVSERAKFLQKHSQLFECIEGETFEDGHLKNLQSKLVSEGKSASKSLGKLATIIGNMEQGGSLVGLIFNGLWLWSLQYLYRLEQWQEEQKEDISIWFDALAHFDALQSLANLYYNHPNYTFPQVLDQDQEFLLEGTQLGHPLLLDENRVNNPANLAHLGQLILITGANMAGKSTYLRTVGVNLILGMTGAPVCAEQMCFKPIEIYTSMRTQDSLQANESFFYAELKRLQTMVEQLKEGKSLFIILDEILKGTNSADQHSGSKALIEQLIRRKGVGLIATHDLSLGTLSEKYPENLRNQCFEIDIIQDELQFDYQLREGLSQNLNATFLMKKMGITE